MANEHAVCCLWIVYASGQNMYRVCCTLVLIFRKSMPLYCSRFEWKNKQKFATFQFAMLKFDSLSSLSMEYFFYGSVRAKRKRRDHNYVYLFGWLVRCAFYLCIYRKKLTNQSTKRKLTIKWMNQRINKFSFLLFHFFFVRHCRCSVCVWQVWMYIFN